MLCLCFKLTATEFRHNRHEHKCVLYKVWHKNNKTDPVRHFIYIIQKIICDRLHSSPLLSLNTAAYNAATVQSSAADYFL